jgi:hypothetical protein
VRDDVFVHPFVRLVSKPLRLQEPYCRLRSALPLSRVARLRKASVPAEAALKNVHARAVFVPQTLFQRKALVLIGTGLDKVEGKAM